jgi:hypothetical protein
MTDTVQNNKNIIFLVTRQCRLVDVHRRFGGTYLLNLQGLKVSQAGNQQQCHMLRVGFLLGLFFKFEDGGNTFLRNVDELLPKSSKLQPSRS